MTVAIVRHDDPRRLGRAFTSYDVTGFLSAIALNSSNSRSGTFEYQLTTGARSLAAGATLVEYPV